MTQQQQAIQFPNQGRTNGRRTLKWNALKLNQEHTVQETDDEWVIPGSVVTREGVHNFGLKRAEDLARTYHLADGIPFTHNHPFDIIVTDLSQVGGWFSLTGFDPETGSVQGDLHLLKRSIDGLSITDLNVTRNEETVEAFQNGDEIHLSIGYFSTDDFLQGDHDGDPYEWIEREIVYNHVARVGHGACSWDDGCGMGRGQPGNNEAETENDDMTQAKKNCNPPAGNGGEGEPSSETPDGSASSPAPASGATANAALQEALEQERTKRNEAEEKANELETKIETRLKALEDEKEQAVTARLNEKRARLAQFLDVKPDDEKLGKLNEQGLDLLIERESQYRGITDNAQIGVPGPVGEAPEPVNGIQDTGYGFTVVDFDKAAEGDGAGKDPLSGGDRS